MVAVTAEKEEEKPQRQKIHTKVGAQSTSAEFTQIKNTSNKGPGFPGSSAGKESACDGRRPGFRP